MRDTSRQCPVLLVLLVSPEIETGRALPPKFAAHVGRCAPNLGGKIPRPRRGIYPVGAHETWLGAQLAPNFAPNFGCLGNETAARPR